MSEDLFADTVTAPGVFVTVDGPNGSGKSTLIAAVPALLNHELAVHSTRQPSPTPLGDLIRESEQKYRGRALACLVAGDRHQQLAREILPRLRDGAVVLCDRYVESSLVLQRLDGVSTEEILAINRGIVRPDLRIRLLADADILSERLAARPADASRRFDRLPGASERELVLYEEADGLLSHEHEIPATIYDTSHTDAPGLAESVMEVIRMYRDQQR
jgi:dTMP kinase